MQKRRVLLSYGYGAGWSTWAEPGKEQQVAEYRPIIDYLDAGGSPSKLDDEDHPLVAQMIKDLDLGYFFTGGAHGLGVVEVEPPYRIDEYDGAEIITSIKDLWK